MGFAAEGHPSVLTIGYGGRSRDELLAVLAGAGITHVADVRSVPASSALPAFNGPDLQAELRGKGIGYVFLGRQLGGRPDDPAAYTADGHVDYIARRRSPDFQAGIDRLCTGLERGLRLVVLCSEGQPDRCHRTKMVAAALVDRGVAVGHIDPDDSVVPHSVVMHRITGGQQSLGFVVAEHESVGAYSRPPKLHP